MSHAIQLSAQREINHHARKFGEHEWFAEENKFKALEALEAYAYASFNNVPNLPAQYKRQALSALNRDKAEKAVCEGRRMNIPSKLFALHEGNMLEPFAIKSSKFDWKVLPLEISNESVPAFVMRNLMGFRQAGIVFESFAVAVPGSANYPPAGYTLKHEATRTLNQLGRAAKTTAIAAGAVVVGAIAVPAAVIAAALQDPVFLGSYGEEPVYLVEIGRWI